MTLPAKNKFINLISFCDDKKLAKIYETYYLLYLYFYPSVTGKPLRFNIENRCVQSDFGAASSQLVGVAQRISISSLQPSMENCPQVILHSTTTQSACGHSTRHLCKNKPRLIALNYAGDESSILKEKSKNNNECG